MAFRKGTKVRLVHTGEEGIVVAVLGSDLFQVKLEEDFEIPVAADDLVLAEASQLLDQQPSGPGRRTRQEQKARPAPPPKPPPRIIRGNNTGLYLAFDPVFAPDGSTSRFQAFLLNDTDFDYLVNGDLTFADGTTFPFDTLLSANTSAAIGRMEYDQLNEAPEMWVEFRQLTTAGPSDPEEKRIKVKAKKFFAHIEKAPVLNRPAHVFRFFQPKADPEADSREDLREYTRKHVQPGFRFPSDERVPFEVLDSGDLKTFVPEIDLHIEQLTDEHQKMSNAEIVRLQMAELDRFLEKAIRLGVPRVFIIHGVGKGRLRDAIATHLFQIEAVTSFKNEYHPRYGWGATEVEF